jgi:hypothetical protein
VRNAYLYKVVLTLKWIGNDGNPAERALMGKKEKE